MTTETHLRQGALSADEQGAIHAWWRTADYLSVGHYFLANPLLREPLRPEHVKPEPRRAGDARRRSTFTSTASAPPSRQ